MRRDALSLSRRRFVQGVAGGALVLGSGRHSGWAQERAGTPAVLSGSSFDLQIGELDVNYTGAPRVATVVNGQLPAPLLRWKQGDTVTLRVTNRLSQPTSIHWHGLIVPADMDGVPGVSFAGIAPGATFEYRFKVNQSGTYWYHAHSRFQEQTGLYGPIVVERAGAERQRVDRDYTVLLSDWTDIDPERIYATLKKHSDYYNFGKRTAGDFLADTRTQGFSATLADRSMWARMRMNPTDLVDVSGYAYTYLMNGVTPNGNWTGVFAPGERVRLRFINGSSMSFFDVRIPGLKLTVVAADGQDVEPVSVDEFRISAAETYDVIVEPAEDRAYTIFAQSMDRSGYARGTLAPRVGMTAAVPPLDARPSLTMADMGHGGGGHGGHAATDANQHANASVAGNEHAAQASHVVTGTEHAAHAEHIPARSEQDAHTGHAAANKDMHASHAAVGGAEVSHAEHAASASGHDAHAVSAGGQSAGDIHAGHETAAAGTPAAGAPVQHSDGERSPAVDMLVNEPNTRLDDPGLGLRNNGRKVLTYADLRTLGGPIDNRPPSREIELHLTGHMERFMWSFNGQKFSEAEPLRFRHGERLRIVLINDTMMTHPIHLHGMWSEVESPDGAFQVRKHTVTVQPAQKISYLVTADALGRWAYHCHLLYHMEAGMFREVVVAHGSEGSEATPPAPGAHEGHANHASPASNGGPPVNHPTFLTSATGLAFTLTLLVSVNASAQAIHQHNHQADTAVSSSDTHVPPDPPATELPPMSHADMERMMQMDDAARHSLVSFDKLEWRDAEDSTLAWDAQADYGGDYNKLVLKAEGERSDNTTEHSRGELLWDRIISPWWSLQTGVRHDFGAGPSRTWAAFGVQGLSPYWFELEATVYVGESSRTAARLEAEYDVLLTQRWILQPDLELNFYGKDDPAADIRAGLSDLQLGFRLRYEIRRELAPYFGVAWVRNFGAREDDVQALAGVKIWF